MPSTFHFVCLQRQNLQKYPFLILSYIYQLLCMLFSSRKTHWGSCSLLFSVNVIADYIYIRLCEERNPNLIVQIFFLCHVDYLLYRLSLFVSVVYKSSASHSPRLLVIKAADEVWMLALIHPTEGQFRFSKTKNEVN